MSDKKVAKIVILLVRFIKLSQLKNNLIVQLWINTYKKNIF